MAQLPNVKLNVHPSMFDLMMAVLERNITAEAHPQQRPGLDGKTYAVFPALLRCGR